VQCHDLGSVTRARYDEKGWLNNLNMMNNVAGILPKDRVSETAKYFAQHFPERPKPNAVLIPGSAKVIIKNGSCPRPARGRMIRSRLPTELFGIRDNLPTHSVDWIPQRAR
jgi:hypothetical protein